ncbi:MAG: fluoride efflux transporter CrcB [Planctomycetaceae bacterium]
MNFLAVGLGGFVGAIARYAISGILQNRFPGFRPAGTLVVNLLGCLLIGFLMAIVISRPNFSHTARLFLITGILGSLTTFSTFGYETVELLREQEYRGALWNILSNLVVGLLAVGLGLWSGSLITAE